MKSLSLVLVIGTSALFLGGCSNVDISFWKGESANTSQENVQIQPITESEKADLLFLREEEKLAHDVYQALYEKWGGQTFANIKEAESRHASQVVEFLIQNGITDTALNLPVGTFQNADLQKLYTDLVAKGSVSLDEAMKVGVFVEEYDIKDLRQKLINTKNFSLQSLYEKLENGSENHLRAFSKQISNYTPQILSQVEYDEIIAGQNMNKKNKRTNKHEEEDEEEEDDDEGNRSWKGSGNH